MRYIGLPVVTPIKKSDTPQNKTRRAFSFVGNLRQLRFIRLQINYPPLHLRMSLWFLKKISVVKLVAGCDNQRTGKQQDGFLWCRKNIIPHWAKGASNPNTLYIDWSLHQSCWNWSIMNARMNASPWRIARTFVFFQDKSMPNGLTLNVRNMTPFNTVWLFHKGQFAVRRSSITIE